MTEQEFRNLRIGQIVYSSKTGNIYEVTSEWCNDKGEFKENDCLSLKNHETILC